MFFAIPDSMPESPRGISSISHHHEDMLVLRLRPTAAAVARRLRAGADQQRAAPGLHALHRHEADEALHYALPLGRAARRQVARAGTSGKTVSALAAAAGEHEPSRLHTGHVLIRLRDPRHRASLLRKLSADPHVASVSRVPTRYLVASEASGTGALPPERMWNHARIQLPAARRLREFRSPRRVTVAVIDSGVDLRHPALRGRVAH
jgi:hypothetical protein